MNIWTLVYQHHHDDIDITPCESEDRAWMVAGEICLENIDDASFGTREGGEDAVEKIAAIIQAGQGGDPLEVDWEAVVKLYGAVVQNESFRVIGPRLLIR